MASHDIDERYLTFDARLASFQPSQAKKKRGSTAGGRGKKALTWPHKSITPESLASAGFYFEPTPDNIDNVVCFLCNKNMDGWEDGDDPLHEHIKHSSHCGWAVATAVQVELEGYVGLDPLDPDMVAARVATFAGRWPYEDDETYIHKTEQFATAGWKYTPTPEYEDTTTCIYCHLALDCWDPNDSPLDEHRKRSPNCPLFALMEEFKGTKKKGRSKAARGSKASRLSTQSQATMMSEAPSMADTTSAGQDDTVMTTASTMTVGGTKKGRAKKAKTTKARRTKAKKDETMEVVEDEKPAEVVEQPAEHEASPIAPPAKAKRGKKRASDAIEESTMTLSQAPAPKKRATKVRGSAAVNSSVVQAEDESVAEAPVSKKAASKKKTRASNTRKVSAKRSVTPSVVMSPPPGHFPDDDEIERQLEAELEKSLSDDENVIGGSDTEGSRIKAWGDEAEREPTPEPPQEQPRNSADFAMFNPAPVEVHEDEVEDELEALRAEMEVNEPQTPAEQEAEPQPVPEVEPGVELEPEPEPEKLHVPKKGAKTGTRKASKQTKAKRAPQPEPVEVLPPTEEPQPDEPIAEASNDQDASLGSTDTVVRTSQSLAQPPPKRGRGRPSKASRASFQSVEDELAEAPAEPPKKGRGRPPKVQPKEEKPAPEPLKVSPRPASPEPTKVAVEEPKKRGRGRPSKASLGSQIAEAPQPSQEAPEPAKRGRGRPAKKSLEVRNTTDPGVQLLAEAEAARLRGDEEDDDSMELVGAPDSVDGEAASPEADEDQMSEAPPVAPESLLEAPSTPGQGPSPSASARQANLSPSQSPQSSDAENQPPSSVPVASVKTKRVALAPIAATPSRTSPSKRNIIAGLKSQTPWKKIDLDAVMGTPMISAPDKENNGTDRLLRKGKELTSPEKKMTVEEWVYFNASEAEKMLKHECEAMVSRFESEGNKAMSVLEGLECIE